MTVPFPGVTLRYGSDSESVRLLQEYLNFISQYYSEIPSITPTGFFGNVTENAVIAFETLFGFTPNGVVDAELWNKITEVYSDMYIGARLNEGQYPGYDIGG